MSTRNIRNQPFCWQEKKINRLLRSKFSGTEMSKMILLYQTITEIESDFNSNEIKFYTKIIGTYSGLSPRFIPSALKTFEDLGIVKIKEERNDATGKFCRRTIIFTPEMVVSKEKTYKKPISGKPTNGEPLNGSPLSGSQGIYIEDSNYIEHSTFIEHSKKKNIPVVADATATTKTEISQEPTKEVSAEVLSDKFISKDINEILGILYQANKTVPRDAFFGRKIYRDAIKQLIEQVGSKNAINAANFAILVRGKKYAPSATSPLELRDKYGKLEEYFMKEKDNLADLMGINTEIEVPDGVNPFSNTADNGEFNYNDWAKEQNMKGGSIFFGTDFSKA